MPCHADSLCLGDGRFTLSLVAKDPRTGSTASGLPIPQTDLFGYFAIPGLTGNPENPEVFVKLLDGRGFNGSYWVFYGGLTDFEYDLVVTDTADGRVRVYSKPGLEFCGGADTSAFSTDGPASSLRPSTASPSRQARRLRRPRQPAPATRRPSSACWEESSRSASRRRIRAPRTPGAP